MSDYNVIALTSLWVKQWYSDIPNTDLNHDIHRKREFIQDVYSGKIDSKLQINCFDDDIDYSEKKKNATTSFYLRPPFLEMGNPTGRST